MTGSEAVYPKTDSITDHECDLYQSEIGSDLVQSHGVLFILSYPDLIIQQVSANLSDHFNLLPEDLLGQSLSNLLEPDSIALIQQILPTNQPTHLPYLRSHTPQRDWEGNFHYNEQSVLLELEPLQAESNPHSLAVSHLRLRSAIGRLQQVSSLSDFLQLGAAEIQALTGFDRVMVYQFDAQGAGEVVAEAKRPDLSPYLGLHFPATDIPEPSRRLYAEGLLRYIPDLSAAEVPLMPTENPLTHQPPDLSFVTLRGTDPCCVEYHRNMGVSALMVIALLNNQQLWGLISCHHQTPKRIPGAVRSVCELLGQFITAELANKVNYEELDAIVKLKRRQSEFVESIAQAEDLKTALVHPAPRILDLVNAKGAAVCLDDEITLVGATPSLEQVQDLIQWATTQVSDSLFHTDSLPKQYSAAEAYKETATGLLLLRISQVRRYYILWFRPEVLRTVNWAGDPTASLQVGADGHLTLSPRRSFEQWQETVRLTSQPWHPSELANALDLRNAIVGIVLNKADELARMNQALERSNQELESFAYAASHDLKEPLRGIHNYATFLMEDYQELLDEAGLDRLQTLVRLTQRMESLIDVLLKFSQLGQTDLSRQPTDLNELLTQVINVFRISHPQARIDIRIPRLLPTVNVDPVLVNEVFSNLLSNADKYNNQAQPWVEIGYLDAAEAIEQVPSADPLTLTKPIFYVRDNGIGIRERHLETIFRLFKRLHPQTMYGGGTGAGLTIAKKIVERHGGEMWVNSNYGEGSVFYFTLE
ncbi:GAF domain-containing protein [Leptolyngbya sp. NK1-12]|uniref:histidine kinase n=1 Tax=Leptolyngbya sp. NK1-12 TaxID=2547451 RepID=A0AA96WD83_9CYAN|nr:GAF domain-containing protein [Leptolyngbya sp. NK1-12]